MGQICYSLGEHSLKYCVALDRFFVKDALELRLDLLPLEEEDLKAFFKTKKSTVVATYYVDNNLDEDLIEDDKRFAVRLLSQAVVLGADYITIPYDFDSEDIKWLSHLAWNHNCKTIISYHNTFGTPSTSELKNIATKCYAFGADIVKIVTTAHHPTEAKRVLQLYEYFKPDTLIAFAMGEAGRDSRKESFEMGAPFMFASPLRDYSTAEGQLTFYDLLPSDAKRDIRTIFVPSSKSLAIRAIIAASLTNNQKSVINNISFCDDVAASINVAQQLFAEIKVDNSKKSIEIIGHQNIPQDGLKVKDNEIYVGESGLLARICIPLCGLSNEDVVIRGANTLLKRKINDHASVLKEHGVTVSYRQKAYLPATVKGRLSGGEFILDGSKGSQLISGLLFALPFCEGEHILKIVRPTSLPYILNTLAVISDFGVNIDNYDDFDDRFDILLRGDQTIHGFNYNVESDWSAAALWLTAGILAGESGVENLQYDTLQADSLIMDTFDDCHADVGCYSYENGDKNICLFQANRSICLPFKANLIHNPDLIGPLILLALRCEGISYISGINRLYNKESNRAITFVEEFQKLGADIHIEGDVIVVNGSFNNMLHGASVSSHGDHRLALALSVAKLITEGEIEIDDTLCIFKSWVEFNLNF